MPDSLMATDLSRWIVIAQVCCHVVIFKGSIDTWGTKVVRWEVVSAFSVSSAKNIQNQLMYVEVVASQSWCYF